MGAEENITAPVCGQWVVTCPEDGNEEDVKIVSIYKYTKRTGANRSSTT